MDNNMDLNENSRTPLSPLHLDLIEEANAVTLNLLPTKSRGKYEIQYEKFISWCKKKHVGEYSENVILVYFSEKSTTLSAATLWSIYSMLKATLQLKNDVDISKFKKVTAFLKRKSVGYKAKKSNILQTEHIAKFISEAPDDRYLMMKVALIMGVCGACRRDELVKMTVDDIEDKGSIVIVRVPETKTHTPRTFIVDNREFLNIFRKYSKLRPPGILTHRLFLFYKNEKCTSQVVGMNSMGKVPMLIAKYLDLPDPETFTGHCFRRSSATILANSGADLISVKRHGGWTSSSVAEGYIDDCISNKIAVAHRMFPKTELTSEQPTNFENPQENIDLQMSISTEELNTALPSPFSSSGITISNPTNCSFTFNTFDTKKDK